MGVFIFPMGTYKEIMYPAWKTCLLAAKWSLFWIIYLLLSDFDLLFCALLFQTRSRFLLNRQLYVHKPLQEFHIRFQRCSAFTAKAGRSCSSSTVSCSSLCSFIPQLLQNIISRFDFLHRSAGSCSLYWLPGSCEFACFHSLFQLRIWPISSLTSSSGFSLICTVNFISYFTVDFIDFRLRIQKSPYSVSCNLRQIPLLFA